MKKILVASHGNMASGLSNSLHLFLGSDFYIETIDAYTDDSNYDVEVEIFLNSLEEGEQGLIFTDILGGSVNQQITEICKRSSKSILLVSNTNLPLIICCAVHAGDLSSEDINKYIADCNPIQIDLNDEVTFKNIEEDEFF